MRPGTGRASRSWLLAASAAAFAVLVAVWAPAAFAGSLWRLDSSSAPTYLAPGEEARIIAIASNIGNRELKDNGAHPVQITDRLPAGLQVPVALAASAIEGKLEANERLEAASRLECAIEEAHRKEVSCKTRSTTQPVPPYTALRVTIPVEASAGAASGEENTVSVSGGETQAGEEPPPPAPVMRPITVKAGPTPFGIERYELSPEEANGAADTWAGSHPFQLTTTLDLNETLAPGGEGLRPSAPSLAKKLTFELPPGLLGDPQAIPQCSDVDFSTIAANDVNACPADTAIGVALVTLNLPSPPLGVFTEAVPVFNLAPAPGEPARFGLEDTKVPIILDTSVRSNGDYGVDVTIRNTTQVAQVLSSQVTLWGQPGSEAHDGSRGWACIRKTEVNGETCVPPTSRETTPFLTLPTACAGAVATQLSGEAWTGETAADEYTFQTGLGEPLARLEGCERVPFSPAIDVSPVEEQEGAAPGAPTTTASTPTGMNVTVKLPAEGEGLGEAAVEDTTVTLPAGVALNPSAANGLQACSESQIGYEGEGPSPDPFSPGTQTPLRFSISPVGCPDGSKVGVVRIKSPDLAHELEGGVYLAAQNANPFGSLFALYIAAEDPVSRILVKLAGQVTLNEATGQVTTTFTNTPQVPFEELRLHFFEGPRASLSTPAQCGSYTTTSSFASWSGATREPPATEPFRITTGTEGAACSNPLAFSPSFLAGVSDLQAGAFTPFTLTIGHPDADQPLSAITVHLPAGVAALLSTVTPCQEPPAGWEWACGPESLIGHSSAFSGLGSDPYELPGSVYLTSGYGGAPFGILDVTPAIAGPFNLGNVDVRSKITVDPNTAAVTITSDPFPQHVKGIPVSLKQINVTVDRPGFEFNPTSCNPMAVSGTLTGAQGATAPVSSPFQLSGCASLPFDPTLTATAGGHGSKANGTSLAVTVTSGGIGPGGVAQAGIAKVDLRLPLALSSRLPTLQKACTAALFNANPASCDEGSVIGNATIHTPVLKSALTGPAYLVSHGGAAFPDVEFVLQGEGITLVLDGKTDIKNGITYSRFESAPDAPFTVFETVLPAGPHGVLTPNVPEKENYSLCKANLEMPTEITGQNGAVLDQNTMIVASGCGGVLSTKTKLTRAQLLARALKACRKLKNKRKRLACVRHARKKYAAKKATAKQTTRHR